MIYKSILKTYLMVFLPLVPIIGIYGQDSLISLSYHSGITNLKEGHYKCLYSLGLDCKSRLTGTRPSLSRSD